MTVAASEHATCSTVQSLCIRADTARGWPISPSPRLCPLTKLQQDNRGTWPRSIILPIVQPLWGTATFTRWLKCLGLSLASYQLADTMVSCVSTSVSAQKATWTQLDNCTDSISSPVVPLMRQFKNMLYCQIWAASYWLTFSIHLFGASIPGNYMQTWRHLRNQK